MRAFVAIKLPKEIESEMAKIQGDLKKTGLEAKWVKPENVHLTIAFLGSIDNKQVVVIKKILSPINRLIEKPIKLRLRNLSAFPNVSRARIVFVDLFAEIERLNDLALKIRNELKNKRIWFDEKPFIAHLTLGRFKKPENLTYLIKKIVIEHVSFEVKEFFLYQSQLSSLGSIYTKL